MASVHIARYADMDFMFNVSAGVGKNRPNQRLDVMLVQYLLNMASALTPEPSGSSTSPIRPPGEFYLEPDGACGPATLRWIAHYQTYRNAHTDYSQDNSMPVQPLVATDGAIDPWTYPVTLNLSYASPSTMRREMTMAWLSYDAAKAYEVRQGHFTSMPKPLAKILMAH